MKKSSLVTKGISFAFTFFQACAPGEDLFRASEESASASLAANGCPYVAASVSPVPAELFIPGSYEGRAFLKPANHLGEDIALPEGFPVEAIAAGRVVYYGPASGYGDLLVVIEHTLSKPVTVKNGNGDFTTTDVFLSISGHLRPGASASGDSLGLAVGQCVTAKTPIGYVEKDAENGDGKEHLHTGIRLSSDAAAHAKDGAAAYRGYDTASGKWKGDFTSTHELLSALAASPTWHPDGTLIQAAGSPEIYRLEWGKRRHIPSEADFENARLWSGGASDIWHRVVSVSELELSCYEEGEDDHLSAPSRFVSCPDGIFYAVGNGGTRTPVSAPVGTPEYAVLLESWGFLPNEVAADPVLCGLPAGAWDLLLRDGTLVKEQGKPDVYAVADGIAWPIDAWDTFLAFGYKQANILSLPPKTLAKYVLGVSGKLLAADDLNRCMAAQTSCDDQICLASTGGGEGIPVTPEESGNPCVPGIEACNGQDDDCDGAIDEDDVCASPPPPSPSSHKVRVAYPATSCLNTDIGGGWPTVCTSGSFDFTWENVGNGLKRMNYAVGGQWLCGETSPGSVVTPYGLPQVWIDDAPQSAFAIHDWRMSWGCNIMLCVGGACELCCDGADNDSDGKVDLADPDCSDAVACY